MGTFECEKLVFQSRVLVTTVADLAGEMTAPLATTFIIFKDNNSQIKYKDVDEVAGTSGIISFAWILSKILTATSDARIHAARTRCRFSDWPRIIEEKEMPNAVRCEDSFVEKNSEILKRNIGDRRYNRASLHKEHAVNLSTHTLEPSRCCNSICYNDDDDDDDEESTIPLNEIISQIPSSIAITPVLPTIEPKDSLIMGGENLSTIPEKEPDEFIKSSVEDLVPIPSEFEDTSDNDSECDLPFCDNYVTFSNPLFDANDDFTSSDDESLPEEDVQEENFKTYSNPLFEFYEEYISSDVNPLFNEVLEEIKSKDSYVSNLDELALLDGYHDSEGDVIYLECLLTNDTTHNLPPEVFLDHDPRSLKDEPDNDDLKSMVKVFDPGIHEKIISLTYVRLPFEDRHYFSLTFVIRIFLPYLTYSMDSSLLLSSGSEDTIFDPDISVFSFYSLEPVVSHRSGTFMCFNVYLNILNESPMEIFSSTCFVPNITMIWGESS
ncbi:hypothetical protein Tco_1369225 [Tanacetum coccineum]